MRFAVVMHASTANEGHGTGFRSPAVLGVHVGVGVVPDADIVRGVLDETQRLYRDAAVSAAAQAAGAFAFLASDATSCITGQVLPVDGGMVM